LQYWYRIYRKIIENSTLTLQWHTALLKCDRLISSRVIRIVKNKYNMGMTGKIIIDIERCKGCGLCISVCPKNGIFISKSSNKAGYFPAQPVDNSDCTGCAMCAIICPEAGIEVYREDDGTIEINTTPNKEKLQPQSCKSGSLK